MLILDLSSRGQHSLPLSADWIHQINRKFRLAAIHQEIGCILGSPVLNILVNSRPVKMIFDLV